ncbi:PQQ-dependent sugar dehydrogenase [Lacinutrix cladophorae]
MNNAKLIFILLPLIFISCKSDDDTITPSVLTELMYVNAFPELTFNLPLDIQSSNDGTDRLFIVEQEGIIKVIDIVNPIEAITFLDISSNVDTSSYEQGLLGLAFHPDYETNGYFYVNYNPNPETTRISRFQVSSSNSNMANMSTELIVLEFYQDTGLHNGGQLVFGQDGYLYISSGDGGVRENGQDLSSLTGTILRIDVDNTDSGMNYGIPIDNPFTGNVSARNEIFAYGLRNPWRISFDNTTGKLWTGDVGNGQREEIDIIESGGNYGWSIFEGTHCLDGPCDTPNLIGPIYEYERIGTESIAITGGYVYRGSLNVGLVGKYIYSDSSTGKIWALDTNSLENELLFETEMNIATFGVDKNKELYFGDYNFIEGGKIYKLVQQEVE